MWVLLDNDQPPDSLEIGSQLLLRDTLLVIL